MKPFKIQNRSTTSRRVKFIKNGGLIQFTKESIQSYVENSREAGFCLTAINPLPPKESATKTIVLTAHPMGTDGRVSLFVDGTLTESMRYVNLARLTDRQVWFNQNFGTVVQYTGRETAKFESLVVGKTYRLVFEDDDLDFVFGEFGESSIPSNPTLVVEQYRLAFDLFNNKVEISCDGAVYETPYMSLAGEWQLEINGEVYTSTSTSVEELLQILEANDIDVVGEGENEGGENTTLKVTDFTLFARYNPVKKRLEGYYHPDHKLAMIFNDTPESEFVVPVSSADGRWYYDFVVQEGVEYIANIMEYVGDINEIFGPDDFVTFESINNFDLVFSANSPIAPTIEIMPDTFDTYGKFNTPVGNGHLHYRVGAGPLEVDMRDLSRYTDPNEFDQPTPLVVALTEFINTDLPISTLGMFFARYTNCLDIYEYMDRSNTIGQVSYKTFRFLIPNENTIPLETSQSVTFYRGMHSDSTDLFDLLFPGYAGNSITLTANAEINKLRYLTPINEMTGNGTGKLVVAMYNVIGPNELVHYDLTDPDNIQIKLLDSDKLINLSTNHDFKNDLDASMGEFKFVNGGDEFLISQYSYGDLNTPTTQYLHTALANGEFQLKGILDWNDYASNVLMDGEYMYQPAGDTWVFKLVDGKFIDITSGWAELNILSSYLIRPNTFIQIGTTYIYGGTGYVHAIYGSTFDPETEAYTYHEPNTKYSLINNTYSRQSKGCVTLSDVRSIVAYDNRIFDVIVPLENQANVIWQPLTDFNLGNIHVILTLSETETDKYFMVGYENGLYTVHRYIKADDVFELIGEQALIPNIGYVQYQTIRIETVKDNLVAVWTAHNYEQIIRFYHVDITTGALTHIDYDNFNGRRVTL